MVKMSEQNDMSGSASTLGGGIFNFNPLDILKYLLSNWYWFVLSVGIFVGYAWYQYAQMPYLYSRSATVMIKDPYSRSSGALDRFSTFQGYTNVSNEILQFQSHKLMRDVVKRLNADISYIVMDGLREQELYTQTPVKAVFPDTEDYQQFSFTATPLNETEVRLSDFSEAGVGRW